MFPLFISSSRSINEYEKICRVGEGAYGIVYKAKDKTSGSICAIKRILASETHDYGFPLSSLREISILKRLNHINIINVIEILNGVALDQIFMSIEYCDYDLGTLIDHIDCPFDFSEIKCLMKQIFGGIAYLHDQNIIHRDLKLSNILISPSGLLKIGDFGLARYYEDGDNNLTPGVVTLWYRAPEILFGSKSYSKAIDLWAVGCIFGELLCHKPFMPGRSELEQLDLIVDTIGSFLTRDIKYFSKFPNFSHYKCPKNLENRVPEIVYHSTDESINLLNSLLVYIPHNRITAKDALAHKYFFELPRDPSEFPKYPSLIETISSSSSSRQINISDQSNEVLNQKNKSNISDTDPKNLKNSKTRKKTRLNSQKLLKKKENNYDYEFDLSFLANKRYKEVRTKSGLK
ncbi:hypothetical protein BB560_003084 [Smittium megazygosporum]|uniref:Protein kinase domain-containing protein n=1 Tax=Smittium megazygosporum TaxID=133381 RepID=A0A2T9ZCY8_9FUNG|nr:hypothetical protein BB560_003084 [Smittium megazygosporum]